MNQDPGFILDITRRHLVPGVRLVSCGMGIRKVMHTMLASATLALSLEE
jgi:hypothetical protein